MTSRGSTRSRRGGENKTDGYTGDEDLREFTFTIGVASAQGRFLKAKNGIAEMAGRKLGDDISVDEEWKGSGVQGTN